MILRLKLHLLLLTILSSCICYLAFPQVQNDNYRFGSLTADNGLSNNQIRSFYQDSRGFIWISTLSGLNRYDGYNFSCYYKEPFDTASLLDNSVNSVIEDLEGNLWVNTSVGFCIFDPVTESFQRNRILTLDNRQLSLHEVSDLRKDKEGNFWIITTNNELVKQNAVTGTYITYASNPEDSFSFRNTVISTIIQDNEGYYWIAHSDGLIEKLEPKSMKVVYRKEVFTAKDEQYFLSIFCDSQNDIWIYNATIPLDLVWYHAAQDRFEYIKSGKKGFSTNSDLISSIVEDSQGKIWIATDHGGINIIDKELRTVHYLMYKRNDEKSLNQNSLTSVYRDNNDIIWVGTYKQGVNFYHEQMFVFETYVNDLFDPKSLQYNDVHCFTEDAEGNLVIGTNGGGINYFDRSAGTFVTFQNSPSPGSLSNDIIVSLYTDSRKNVWVGTYHGGLNKFDGVKFDRFLNEPNNARSIPDNRVWSIFEDSRENLWIGTLGGGLALFDRKHNAFIRYNTGDNFSIPSDYIIAIQEDNYGDLWIGTSEGVYVMKWTMGEVVHYSHSENDPNTLSNNLITTMLCDSRGLVWVGTRDGLNLFLPESGTFYKFRTENGLLDNTILSIVDDDLGNIWVVTNEGVSRLDIRIGKNFAVEEYSFINYDKDNGIKNQSFNERSAYKTSSGEIVIGGSNGFYLLRPEKLADISIIPPVKIVNFYLHGESVKVDSKKKNSSILKKSILYTENIELQYSDNVFSIEFSALAFLNPERIKYQYILEGFNDEWISTSYTDRKITYTNLDPGKYVFKVRAFVEGNTDNYNEAILNLLIKPPFWRSKVAISLYFILIVSLLFFFRQVSLMGERLKFQNEQAKQEALRQQELNAIKTRFFTNVSHEFRTPLTLILTPLERLKKKYSDMELGGELDVIYSNAKRLLGLINQLLDFRKMEEQRLALNPEYGNVVIFLKEVFKSFKDLARTNEIEYNFESFAEEFFMRFDHDKLEKIVFNLLSNAFKYTPKNGKILLRINLIPFDNVDNPISTDESLLVEVVDTGIGISDEKHNKIFERFFQNEQPTGTLSRGSGIGLSLTQEFVNLHNGVIKLESKVDKGSTFSVYLPVDKSRIEERLSEEKSDERVVSANEVESEIDTNFITILLVEDNEDFRFYLRDNLKVNYKILEASNGAEAWPVIKGYMPDLIVSDLMMPEVDGIELCAKVKQNEKTSHIPFLILTASLTHELEVKGFQSGADAYITKPFSFEILEARIRNFVARRELMKKQYQKNFKIEPGSIGITSLDEKLMNKALKLVEENITDSEFSVEKLSSELGFSRVHLYKKMSSITGKTPVEFIRLVRLKRAAQLLRESQLTVSEIAYQVGFSDPRYFSKIFKSEFKMLPSQYKNTSNS
ncbi:MAG: response regulator [Bacteroidales bacterium]|nr:response regulator [Bacteroidales bacterium]MBN2817526.1 response regulator [Bacteroidales bacterium]